MYLQRLFTAQKQLDILLNIRQRKGKEREQADKRTADFFVPWSHCCLDTKPCEYNKIFILRFRPIILLFFSTPPLLGLWGSVSHLQHFRQCCMCLWGHTEKGIEVLWRRGGMHSIRDNRGEQWNTKPQQDSLY